MEWKSLTTKKPIDLSSYLVDWMANNPEDKIYIGCDSQNHNGTTTFATVIVLHQPNRGGHVLYSKITIPRIQARYERLWKEIELSAETAHEIMENAGQTPDFIDIDLNPDPRFKSNSVLRQAVGLVEGMGYKVRYKHLGALTTYAANHLVRI
jgi:predicted RNase H-related nuclease YkuK (DUF458 family)